MIPVLEIPMERDRWKEHNRYFDQLLSAYDSAVDRDVPNREHIQAISSSSSSVLPISSSSVSSSLSPPRLGYIEHPISKFDTLAGIAIKYGVEVADIKRMNGLVTDRQMFALKTLHIPLPGRHPPSPCLQNGSGSTGHGNSDHSPPDHACRELFESFQSLRMKSPEEQASSAISSEVLEKAMYRKGAFNSPENSSFQRNSPTSNRPLIHHRKSRSLVNVILEDVMGMSDTMPVVESREYNFDKWNETFLWRNNKSETDFTSTPELLMRPDNSNRGWFSSRTGKGLAQRQKVASRPASATDSVNPLVVGMGDAFVIDGPSGVRKSSSTSCLQDQDNYGSSSIWSTSRWSLKPELQAKPIFDGLPKPVTNRKNKAALD